MEVSTLELMGSASAAGSLFEYTFCHVRWQGFEGESFGARLRDYHPGAPEIIGNIMYWEEVSTADGHLLPP